MPINPLMLTIAAALIATAATAAEPEKKSAAKAGADWWSLQPIQRPALPEPADPEWRVNPIDRFIKAKLEEKKMAPNPEAELRTYIRRVTLDLTGLLPTPEEIDAFLQDASAKPQTAREKLVDRLLASPAYGERWGRHWLDVVRFAESHGYEMNTLRPNAWPYRDYVIRAFNRDTPFSRFVLEQLAGDTIPNADLLTQAATGFLVAGPHDLVGNATLEGKLQIRSDDLFDMASTTSTVFLGLTAGCARCHDHKFDPISQKDFYRLQAVFAGVDHAERLIKVERAQDQARDEIERLQKEQASLERRLDLAEPLAIVNAKQLDKQTRSPVNAKRNVEHFATIEAKFVRITVRATNDGNNPCVDELEIYGADYVATNLGLTGKPSASSEYPNNPIHKIAHLNDGRHGNGRSWISNERGVGWAQIELAKAAKIDCIVWGRDREGRYADRLPTNYTIEVSGDATTWTAVAGSVDRAPVGTSPKLLPANPERKKLLQRQKEITVRLAELVGSAAPIFAGNFRTPEATHILFKGDVLKKTDEVTPASLMSVGKPWSLPTSATDAERRTGLAKWLTDAANPLPARVLVNRIWHYHFGQGIVRTPSDFGFNGSRPSHPELLDWLAAEYQSNGGKMKPLHKLVVLSKTYRQSGNIDPGKAKVDAGNQLLWRFPSRRLEAEAIRDSILQTSGALDRTMGGPGYHLWTYSGYVIVFTPKPKLGPDEFRRMVYQFKPRLQQDGTFGTFDCPDGTSVAPRRTISTTALQALNLLNDEFVYDQADRFAERLRRDPADDATRIRRAFVLAFGREPGAREAAAAERLVKDYGLATFCRALFNANELVTME